MTPKGYVTARRPLQRLVANIDSTARIEVKGDCSRGATTVQYTSRVGGGPAEAIGKIPPRLTGDFWCSLTQDKP